jgi:MarR family transcriptional repressor of emrRAB
VDRLNNVVGALALAVTDAVRQSAEEASGHTDAGPAALTILLTTPHGRSVDELRRAVGLTPSGGVRLVDRLVGDGLVERRPGTDGRSVLVTLTRRGRHIARTTLTARADAIEHILAPLDAGQRATLEGLVETMLGAHVVEKLRAPRTGGWVCRLCDQVACGRDQGRCPAATAASITDRPALPPDRRPRGARQRFDRRR